MTLQYHFGWDGPTDFLFVAMLDQDRMLYVRNTAQERDQMIQDSSPCRCEVQICAPSKNCDYSTRSYLNDRREHTEANGIEIFLNLT